MEGFGNWVKKLGAGMGDRFRSVPKEAGSSRPPAPSNILRLERRPDLRYQPNHLGSSASAEVQF